MSASCCHVHPLSHRTPLWRAALLICAGVAGLAGCMAFPDMEGRLTPEEEASAFPRLVPAETILQTAEDNIIAPDTQDALEDRVARLTRRADGLRAVALDPEARARMEAGIAAPPAPPAAVPADPAPEATTGQP